MNRVSHLSSLSKALGLLSSVMSCLRLPDLDQGFGAIVLDEGYLLLPIFFSLV